MTTFHWPSANLRAERLIDVDSTRELIRLIEEPPK